MAFETKNGKYLAPNGKEYPSEYYCFTDPEAQEDFRSFTNSEDGEALAGKIDIARAVENALEDIRADMKKYEKAAN